MTALLVQLVSKHCNRRALSQNSKQSCSLRETEGERERGKRIETEDKSQQGSKCWGTRHSYVRMSTNPATKRKRALWPHRLPSFMTESKGTHWMDQAECQHIKRKASGLQLATATKKRERKGKGRHRMCLWSTTGQKYRIWVPLCSVLHKSVQKHTLPVPKGSKPHHSPAFP